MKHKYSAYALLVTVVIVVVSWLSLLDSSSGSGRARWGSGYSGGYSGGSYSGGGHK